MKEADFDFDFGFGTLQSQTVEQRSICPFSAAHKELDINAEAKERLERQLNVLKKELLKSQQQETQLKNELRLRDKVLLETKQQLQGYIWLYGDTHQNPKDLPKKRLLFSNF